MSSFELPTLSLYIKGVMKIKFYYYLIYSNATGKNIDEIINISSIYIIYHKNINNIFDGGGV